MNENMLRYETSKPECRLRFRHHFLSTNAILTICTHLNHETRTVDVGWSLFNPNDFRWIKKKGNEIARNRLINHPLHYILSKDEPILCDYLSVRSLLVVLGSIYTFLNEQKTEEEYKNHPISTSMETWKAIQFECLHMINLLGNRIGLPSLEEN